MTVCPTCQRETRAGELFCEDCGTQLLTTSGKNTRSIQRGESGGLANHRGSDPLAVHSKEIHAVSLLVLETEQVLSLTGRDVFTLGRSADGQSILPDIDLAVFQGYEKGVSRMHASIRLGSRLTVTDLGSSNGTRLNGVKITSNRAYPLQHGDVLTLGKLKVQILTRVTG